MNTFPYRQSYRGLARQGGQGIAESILACSILLLLMAAASWMWKFGELKQYNTEAVRFATWERTVYQEAAGDEMKAIYASDAELAADTFRYTYLKPHGRRGAEKNGGASIQDNGGWGTVAARFFSDWMPNGTFNGLINNAITVTTNSASPPGKEPLGFDPTGNTLTSLKLDREQYETVSVSAEIDYADFLTNFVQQRFGIVPPVAGNPGATTTSNVTLGQLSLVNHTWSAPGTVAIRRVYEELGPLSKVNPIGRYVFNNPDYFNLNAFIGGAAGFAGNYRVDMPGLDPGQAASTVGGALAGNPSNNAADWMAILQPTNAHMETMNMAPTAFARFDMDYAGLVCAPPRVPEAERLETYTQDARCPANTVRSRTMSFFDLPAWRFSTTKR